MKTVIVFDHPYTAAASENMPHNRSFCAALCKRVRLQLEKQGEEVDLMDLHADGFDPVMSAADLANWRRGVPMDSQVADYQDRIREANRIVFIFPVWWELMPAMTKGFIDKVYAKNVLYDQGDGTHMATRLRRDTRVVVMTVMSTSKGLYKTVFGKPVVKALQRGTFSKTGLRNFSWMSYSGVDRLSPEQREKLLESVTVE